VELARLLNKLEGRSPRDDPAARGGGVGGGKDGGGTAVVRRLEVASASDFGRPAAPEPGDDHRDHDGHLRPDDDDEGASDVGADLGDFFHRAFAGAGGRGPSSPGMGGFRYFSSPTSGVGGAGGWGGFGYGGRRQGGGGGEEDDHKVECNQM
jgi:hypothetical protein